MRRLVLLLGFVLIATSCGSSDTASDAVSAATLEPTSTPSEPEPTAEEPAPPNSEEAPPEPTETAAEAIEAPTGSGADDAEVLFPDVVDATITADADGTYTVSTTLSSPYDSAARYADAWRVLGPDGTALGIRELGHDHADEQPFTRSLSSVEISNGISAVTIEGRDQISGWGGETLDVEVPTP